MHLRLSRNSVFVFDLDDTLYREKEFLISAFKAISSELLNSHGVECFEEMLSLFEEGKDVFGGIISKYKFQNVTKEDLICRYRTHYPSITLNPGMRSLIKNIHPICLSLGILTDGRSITQRNKISALGIGHYFDSMVISEEFGSEKPNEANYKYFEKKYVGADFIYFGDNLEKDFLVPNKFGWNSICLLDSGQNIHKQNLNLGSAYMPNYFVRVAEEIEFAVKYKKELSS